MFPSAFFFHLLLDLFSSITCGVLEATLTTLETESVAFLPNPVFRWYGVDSLKWTWWEYLPNWSWNRPQIQAVLPVRILVFNVKLLLPTTQTRDTERELERRKWCLRGWTLWVSFPRAVVISKRKNEFLGSPCPRLCLYFQKSKHGLTFLSLLQWMAAFTGQPGPVCSLSVGTWTAVTLDMQRSRVAMTCLQNVSSALLRTVSKSDEHSCFIPQVGNWRRKW